MVMEWVLSAYIPRVGKKKCLSRKNMPRDDNETISTTDKPNKENIQHLPISNIVADTRKAYNQAFSIDKKVLM